MILRKINRFNYRDYLFFNRLINNNKSIDAFEENEQFVINCRSNNFDNRCDDNRSDLSNRYDDYRS